jgi:hypothetical protein
MATITNTAAALVRVGGLISAAAAKVVSTFISPNPLNTKSTLGMADQATRTQVTKTHSRVAYLPAKGDGVTTAFSFGTHISVGANATFTVNGTVTTATLAANKKSVTFAVAPALNAVLAVVEAVSHSNIDDATAAGTLVSAGSVTRTNH